MYNSIILTGNVTSIDKESKFIKATLYEDDGKNPHKVKISFDLLKKELESSEITVGSKVRIIDVHEGLLKIDFDENIESKYFDVLT